MPTAGMPRPTATAPAAAEPTPTPGVDEKLEETVDAIQRAVQQPDFWKELLWTALIFFLCLVVMKVLLTLLERTIQRLKIERSLHTFIKSTARILLWFVTLVIVAYRLGIDMSSFLALFGLVGLAVSLAIQGTLSNLAGGIMVLVSKPFAVGDFIEAGSVSGVVADIGMVYTKVKTVDNKQIFVPNSQISGEQITNYTSQTTRRVDLTFSVSYDDSPELVRSVICKVIEDHPKALSTPEPFVRTSSLNDSSVSYVVRVWCATEDYWDLYYDLLEQVRAAFGQHGIDLTYNHLNVHIQERTGRP